MKKLIVLFVVLGMIYAQTEAQTAQTHQPLKKSINRFPGSDSLHPLLYGVTLLPISCPTAGVSLTNVEDTSDLELATRSGDPNVFPQMFITNARGTLQNPIDLLEGQTVGTWGPNTFYGDKWKHGWAIKAVKRGASASFELWVNPANVPYGEPQTLSIYADPITGYCGFGKINPQAPIDIDCSSGNYAILAGNKRIGNIAVPILQSDACTKGYLDAVVAQITPPAPCPWVTNPDGSITNTNSGGVNINGQIALAQLMGSGNALVQTDANGELSRATTPPNLPANGLTITICTKCAGCGGGNDKYQHWTFTNGLLTGYYVDNIQCP